MTTTPVVRLFEQIAPCTANLSQCEQLDSVDVEVSWIACHPDKTAVIKIRFNYRSVNRNSIISSKCGRDFSKSTDGTNNLFSQVVDMFSPRKIFIDMDTKTFGVFNSV